MENKLRKLKQLYLTYIFKVSIKTEKNPDQNPTLKSRI